jgi:hypothetical protein
MGRHTSQEEGSDDSEEPLPPPEAAASEPRDWSDRLTGTRAAAFFAVAGLVSSLLSLLKGTSFTRLSALGPILFLTLAVVAWRNRRWLLTGAAVVFTLLSIFPALRAYTAPEKTTFFYDGVAMTALPPAAEGGIPLTNDPSVGNVAATIYPEPSDAGPIEVSCVRAGHLTVGNRTAPMEWGQVENGKFATLWIPVPYLSVLGPGAANTLRRCSDWRWQLQNFGSHGS